MIIAAIALMQVQRSEYTIEKIFTAPFEVPDASRCLAINDQSQVLCYSSPLGKQEGGTGIAFLWQYGQVTPIPVPEAGPGERTGIVQGGVSNDGTVVGTYFRSVDSWSAETGFRWTQAGGWQDLTADGYRFEPYAINNNDDIAGVIHYGDQTRAAGILSKSNDLTKLVDIPIDWAWIRGEMGINDKREVVGNAFFSNAQRILPGKEMEPLATPLSRHRDPYGRLQYDDSNVVSVNNSGWSVGQIEVGGVGWGFGGSHLEGAAWSPKNEYYLLGDGGYQPSHINDVGQFVGTVMEKQHLLHLPMHAFICDVPHGLCELDTLVPPGSPMLADATWINNKGEIICQGLQDRRTWYLLRPNQKSVG